MLERNITLSTGPFVTRFNYKNNVWIGTGVTILDGLTIGSRVIVAAGTVVTKNVERGIIIIVIPARLLRFRSQNNRHNI